MFARVTTIRGIPRSDLNAAVLLGKVTEDARAWTLDLRPLLRDDILRDPGRFVLLDPNDVQAELFPKVFWCQNRQCGRIFDYSQRDTLPQSTCRACRAGKLMQLRFVKIHRCGALQPLQPPDCPQCHNPNQMALDPRSERLANFRWICRQCGRRQTLFAGRCRECQWPGDSNLQNMDIEVHRAGRTFYAHTTVLLNVPHSQLDSFFNLPEWPAVAAAKVFRLPEVANKQLYDFVPTAGAVANQQPFTLSAVEALCEWLERNGFPPTLPTGSDATLARRAYFVQLFDDAPLRQTLQADRPQARLVFGLLHTLCHLCVRHAALLC